MFFLHFHKHTSTQIPIHCEILCKCSYFFAYRQIISRFFFQSPTFFAFLTTKLSLYMRITLFYIHISFLRKSHIALQHFQNARKQALQSHLQRTKLYSGACRP